MLLTAACSRVPAKPETARLAILRFENLGGNPADDWMGRAFSDVLAVELSGAPEVSIIPAGRLHGFDQNLGARPASTPGIFSEKAQALAAGATQAGYGEYFSSNGTVHARLTLEDLRTTKAVKVVSVSAGDVLRAATMIAQQMAPKVAPYGTDNLQALRAWALAIEADREQSERQAEAAHAADPSFVPPVLQLAQLRARRQDRSGALEILKQTLAVPKISADDRARIQVEAATIEGDAAAKVEALKGLADKTPKDPAVWRALGEQAMAAHRYTESADAYRKAAEIDAQDAASWKQVGYASALGGDLTRSLDALRRFQQLRPNDPDGPDSVGDAYLLLGKLKEAEASYLQAAKLDPRFLNGGDFTKAAMARLMTGDIEGADAIEKQHVEARKGVQDPLVPFYEAEWAWVSGRRKAACDQLEAFAKRSEAGPLRDLAARAYAESAIWRLMLGERDAVPALVQSSIKLAGPLSAVMAAMARLLSAPTAPAEEWTNRTNQLFERATGGNGKDVALSYALLLAKEFPAAVTVLERLEKSTDAANEPGIPIELAWARTETGKTEDIDRLLRLNPIPPPAGSGAFMSFYFPQIYYLRAVTAERAGKADEARANHDLFRKLSGPNPLVWDR